MTDIQHLQPDYFSFMPSAPRAATSAPDTGAQYLGGDDDGAKHHGTFSCGSLRQAAGIF
jgi:hypothetical protein